MYMQIKEFYEELNNSDLIPIELATWTHAKFVRIPPFIDGNGCTSRLLMNYQLLMQGFLPVSIAKENRLDYYNAIEEYTVKGNLKLFADLLADLGETQLNKFLDLTIEKTKGIINNEYDWKIPSLL